MLDFGTHEKQSIPLKNKKLPKNGKEVGNQKGINQKLTKLKSANFLFGSIKRSCNTFYNQKRHYELRNACDLPQNRSENKCRNCNKNGKKHHWSIYPVKGKNCNNCGIQNHFAKVFRKAKKQLENKKTTEEQKLTLICQSNR